MAKVTSEEFPLGRAREGLGDLSYRGLFSGWLQYFEWKASQIGMDGGDARAEWESLPRRLSSCEGNAQSPPSAMATQNFTVAALLTLWFRQRHAP
jgi:hypothetical protein